MRYKIKDYNSSFCYNKHMNIPQPELITEEDIYADAGILSDATNEIQKIFYFEGVLMNVSNTPLVSLEERYAGREAILQIIREHPAKVRRANLVAQKINANMDGAKDVIQHMRLCNEYLRLVQGKNTPFYHEPEASPTLLDF